MVKVNLVHYMSRYVELKRTVEKYRLRIATVTKMTELGLQPPYCGFYWKVRPAAYFQDLLAKAETELQQLESRKFDHFTQVAFVTFDQDEEAKSVAKFLHRQACSTLWQALRSALCPRLAPRTNLFQGRALQVQRAPEPTDIVWENIGVSRGTELRWRIGTWTATALVLAAGVVVVTLSATIRSKLAETQEGSEVSVQKQVVAFLPTSLVVLVNMLLAFIIRTFSRFEKHLTVTDYNTSVALKQTLALFLNTAMAALVVHWGDFYSAKGLAAEMGDIMISNAVVQQLAYVLNPYWLVRWAFGRLEKRKGPHCMLTQQEANKLLEARKLDMPQRYATLLKTFLLTLVYAPMMPIALGFGVVALVFQYWVDKVMLLRFLSRPERLSHSLDDAMRRVVPIGLLLYAISNWIFFWNLVEGCYVPGLTGVVSAVLYLLSPWKMVLKVWRYRHFSRVANNVIELSESDKCYEDVAVDFIDDYDRANPLTSAEGSDYWVQLIRRKRGARAADLMAEALNRENSLDHRKLQVLKRQHQLALVLKSFMHGRLHRRHVVEESKESLNESQKSVPGAVPFAAFLKAVALGKETAD